MPRVLLNQGVNDMVRISDARMSGTSFGTVVLHIAPESAIGGPLAAVRTGDEIVLDVATAASTCASSDAELRSAPGGFRLPRAALRSGLRPDVPGARDAGQPRLRLRFPGGSAGVQSKPGRYG